MALTVYSLLVAFWLTYHSLSTTLFQHTPITHWSSKASSYAWEDDGICQERSNMTKFKRTGNTHRGTLHAHGDRNNWYIRETIILCWSRCRLRLWINWRWNQVFFVSPTNLKLIEGGGLIRRGCLFDVWLNWCALIRGRALIWARALIRGNTIFPNLPGGHIRSRDASVLL